MSFVKIKDYRIKKEYIEYFYWETYPRGEDEFYEHLIIWMNNGGCITVKGPKTLLGQLEKQMETK